jgi:polar amino acid transport system substrate-binding protein
MKFLIAIFLLFSLNLFGEKLHIMTEEYPPFNYTKDGKVTGLATEIVEDIIKRLNLNTSKIKSMQWSKAYNIIQKKPNHMIYVITRTKQRENLFKWVGPIAENKWVFFAKKGSNIELNSLEDAKKVKRVGTYKDDVCELFLKENGFKNIDSVSTDIQNVKKLNAGRIDLWIAGELQGHFRANKINKGDILEKVLDIKSVELYIAFSKDTPQSYIDMWQKELDNIKSSDKYNQILNRYLK